MMGKNLRYLILLIFTVLVIDCKKPYNPPAIVAANSYLVVDGIINSGTDSTTIRLTQTTNLSSKITVSPVLHAVVVVESDLNATYPLKETKNGFYVSAGLNLDNSRKYRLRIITTAINSGKQYVSDFVSVVNSPPIDSINYTLNNDGIAIFSNTHDAKNLTRYYRWDYQETWVFTANFHSHYKSDGYLVTARNFREDDVYKCWRTDTSNTIVLGSSAKLVNDVIVNNPITSIASSSEKLGTKYSILVKQYGLSADAYKFWQNLKKNTEQLGGVFDAQPSQIIGNIHCVTDPSEPVIGYISAGRYSSVRIFIDNAQLPRWSTANPYPLCKVDTFLFRYPVPGTRDTVNQVNIAINYLSKANSNPKDPLIPIEALPVRPGDAVPMGYTGSQRVCVDCTLRGTNKQPAFWK